MSYSSTKVFLSSVINLVSERMGERLSLIQLPPSSPRPSIHRVWQGGINAADKFIVEISVAAITGLLSTHFDNQHQIGASRDDCGIKGQNLKVFATSSFPTNTFTFCIKLDFPLS